MLPNSFNFVERCRSTVIYTTFTIQKLNLFNKSIQYKLVPVKNQYNDVNIAEKDVPFSKHLISTPKQSSGLFPQFIKISELLVIM